MLARIPTDGGKRVLPQFVQTGMAPATSRGGGYDFLHVSVDDHSRYAYVEALPNEQGAATAAFLERTPTHFASLGAPTQRILTDNGRSYISRAFHQVATEWDIRLKRTRPYRPQTNGKAEAFIKILQREWAYARPHPSNQERLALLPTFLKYYNHDRSHGGIGGATPASRLYTMSLGSTARASALQAPKEMHCPKAVFAGMRGN